MTKPRLRARRSASIAVITQIKDVTKEDALKIRTIWHTEPKRDEARGKIDKVLRTHGIEYLGVHKKTCHPVYYANAGDSYATTVVFHGPTLHVGCWADYVERKLIREPAGRF